PGGSVTNAVAVSRPRRPPELQGRGSMKNFLRALRCAWPYRIRLGVSVLCAVLAAVFWGLNFTAIYPVLKIIGSDKNPQQWIDGEITRVQTLTEPHKKPCRNLGEMARKGDQRDPSTLREAHPRRNAEDLAGAESKLESARRELYRYQLAKKYIDLIFPED